MSIIDTEDPAAL